MGLSNVREEISLLTPNVSDRGGRFSKVSAFFVSEGALSFGAKVKGLC